MSTGPWSMYTQMTNYRKSAGKHALDASVLREECYVLQQRVLELEKALCAPPPLPEEEPHVPGGTVGVLEIRFPPRGPPIVVHDGVRVLPLLPRWLREFQGLDPRESVRVVDRLRKLRRLSGLLGSTAEFSDQERAFFGATFGLPMSHRHIWLPDYDL